MFPRACANGFVRAGRSSMARCAFESPQAAQYIELLWRHIDSKRLAGLEEDVDNLVLATPEHELGSLMLRDMGLLFTWTGNATLANRYLRRSCELAALPPYTFPDKVHPCPLVRWASDSTAHSSINAYVLNDGFCERQRANSCGAQAYDATEGTTLWLIDQLATASAE